MASETTVLVTHLVEIGSVKVLVDVARRVCA
jgi:hypothetical protein